MLLPEDDRAGTPRESDAPSPEPESPALVLSGTGSFDLLEQEIGGMVWEADSRLRYEHALSECAQALLAAPDESAVRGALEALLSATDATFAFLERNVMDLELGMCSITVERVAVEGAPTNSAGDYWLRVPWAQMPTARSHLERGESFSFNIRDLAGSERDLYLGDPVPVVSELDIPIFIQGQWVGLVGFADREDERDWPEADVRLLEVAAALFGAYWNREDSERLLLSNLEERDRRVRYERALAQCSAALLKSREDTALDVALASLMEATEASSVFVERNVHDPELGACSSLIKETSKSGQEVDAEIWGLVPWSSMPLSFDRLSKGEPHAFLIGDLHGREAETYAGSSGKSELDIPIFVDGEWAGLVGFTDRVNERIWGEDEIEFLSTASEIIAAFWERQTSYERLETLIQSKDEFVASVSHELRTPLTAVVGLANELREGFDRFSAEEVMEFIGLIAGQGNEVANIVEDLLVVARADIGTISVRSQEVDLQLHAREAASLMISDQPISIIGDAPMAWADPTRVRQILRNLLTNAGRYGGNEVRIELGVIGDQARLEVCDNGSGVGDQEHERIFEAYHRAHDRRGQPASVGLGLTVSRQLAQLMAGDLSYFRKDGWSVFSLALPVAPGAESSRIRPSWPRTSPGTTGPGARRTWYQPAADLPEIPPPDRLTPG